MREMFLTINFENFHGKNKISKSLILCKKKSLKANNEIMLIFHAKVFLLFNSKSFVTINWVGVMLIYLGTCKSFASFWWTCQVMVKNESIWWKKEVK